MDFLLFRLYAPLSAWGVTAVGENRHVQAHPSRSALLGLMAAALGLTREEKTAQQQLDSELGFAIALERAGTHLSDYHTAQAPKAKDIKKGRPASRYHELTAAPRHELTTILSKRDYRQDMVARVAVWNRSSQPDYSLKRLLEALEHPVFTLYLGRKSCPPSLPLEGRVVTAVTLREALTTASFNNDCLDGLALSREDWTLYWESDSKVTSGIDPQQTFSRRDQPLEWNRRLFGMRQEHRANLAQGRA
ncbi:MAG: type I-E CRISPR-associated protein Cas5/CasD [Magnetococcales bacterium]|nr:type I-E CRISPR-associated protein Cas5/CasD [Magnetococcales bacterium]